MLRYSALLTALILFLFAAPVVAQDDDPTDYTIGTVVIPSFSSDGTEVTLTFSVYNQGAATTQPSAVEIYDFSSGTLITREDDLVPGLATGETVDVEVSFSLTRYTPASNPMIEIQVGRDEIEAENTPSFEDNRVRTGLAVPPYNPSLQTGGFENVEQPSTGETPADASPPQQSQTDSTDDSPDDSTLTIPFVDVDIDLSDPTTALIVAGIALSAVVMLIIIYLLLRLLFARTPTFGTWQPPYASMPQIDPSTNFGRRQQWQQHAQTNVVPTPCHIGTIMPRKLLMGMDGNYMAGWQILAARLTQYDMYGRVSRSEVLASGRAVKRLNRLAKRTGKFDEKRLRRALKPVARSLVEPFKKRINKRSAMLSIALDVRFRASHGEVRILFELYECLGGQPMLIDRWEPEMTVIGRTMYESYTYTLYGQTGSERFNDFRKRLREDVLNVLVEMFNAPTLQQAAQPQPGYIPPDPTPPSRPQVPLEESNVAKTAPTQAVQEELAGDTEMPTQNIDAIKSDGDEFQF